jgi:hypothetical protein
MAADPGPLVKRAMARPTPPKSKTCASITRGRYPAADRRCVRLTMGAAL